MSGLVKRMNKVVKVPVVMQMEALECGAASLAMILAYHGKWIPLEQLRSDCGVSRDGSSAKNVLRAARSYGMSAKGYRYELDSIRTVQTPCIIHWGFNHFLVLCGFRKDKAVLNDPARGRVEVSMEEFDKQFTGICLLFEKTEEFVPGGKPRSVLEFARERLKGTLMPFIFVTLTSLLMALIGVINPAFGRVFMDRILTGENPEWLYPFTMFMGGVVLLQIIVTTINTLYMLKIQGKLAIIANTSFMWHVLRLPMEFFSQRMAGDIAARQSSNENIAATLINQLAPVVLNLVLLVFYFVVMLRYSLLLTAVGLLCAFLNMGMAQIISKKRINITRVMMRDEGKLSGATVSGIEVVESIKASGSENGFFERWTGFHAAVNAAEVRYTRLDQYLGAVPSLVQSISSIAILMLGARQIMDGSFTVGMLLAFQGFMNSFMNPVNKLLSVGQSVQEMRTSMERIEDVMNYKAAVAGKESSAEPTAENEEAASEPEDEDGFTKLSGEVEMKDVTFGYSKLGAPLIEHFNLKLTPGSRVAFVGTSGCGKSTLSKLISGLYEPWSGEILFDGKPRARVPREVFTGSLAVVDQDIIIFEDTIANNIKMWDNSIEDFEMILAARDAQIHEDIMQRDGGYSYKLLEGGKDFSGGQRQRMEIARVLAQDPTIIILDEATSALDAKTEFDVVNAIKDRGITCIIIAHRLSTIRDCDEIIVMDKGKVMERGTHDELYAMDGMYAKLIATE